MSERRSIRGYPPRTDRQIRERADDMLVLEMIAAGRITRASSHVNAPYLLDGDPLWTDLKRLAREDLLFAPISGPPTLQTRGKRLLAVARVSSRHRRRNRP